MIIPLFPVLIHQFEIPNFKDIEKNLIKTSYQQRKKDPKGRVYSNRGGWQSSFLEKEDNIIRSTLLGGIGDYYASNQFFECNINLDSLWININGKGHYNTLHHHPSCDLSGVFWIKTPVDCGSLVFNSPHDFVQAKELTFYTSQVQEEWKQFESYYFPSIAGRVMIFPSFLLHQVRPNESNEDRISVSFNLLLNK